ncbi:CLUMA_CG004414, isoform A [Clunio marinus]|uniref:CLUMA_CG004414, isoform A n=1 Tax=Clunio marinus TaxID=568069 RepID=A0A1J1HX60_9DIPT|nr:CLUMA_CG004414, isoform A [Clunio marinus]
MSSYRVCFFFSSSFYEYLRSERKLNFKSCLDLLSCQFESIIKNLPRNEKKRIFPNGKSKPSVCTAHDNDLVNFSSLQIQTCLTNLFRNQQKSFLPKLELGRFPR